MPIFLRNGEVSDSARKDILDFGFADRRVVESAAAIEERLNAGQQA